jgi:hypothetical protein
MKDRLAELLADAEASGVSDRTPGEIWDAAEAAVRDQYIRTALRSSRKRKPRQQPNGAADT